MRIEPLRTRFPRTRVLARQLAARLRLRGRAWRVVAWPSAGALFVAAVGWGSPGFAAFLSACAWLVGIPSAILFSVYLVHRAPTLPQSLQRRETGHLALLVPGVVLLVPANLVPTKGKERWMWRQGRAAAEALERQYARTGYFPDRLGEVEGAPLLRVGLRYRSRWQDFDLSFDDPGYYFLDSGSWEGVRTTRTWRYVYEDF